MNIDGFNIGTSGAILSTGKKAQHRATASVWVYYHGKYIHFSFLEFKEIAADIIVVLPEP